MERDRVIVDLERFLDEEEGYKSPREIRLEREEYLADHCDFEDFED